MSETVLQRAIAYLTENPGEIRARELGAALEVNPRILPSCLAPALYAGALTRRNEGRAVFYALGDGTEREPAQHAAPEAQSKGLYDASKGFYATLDTAGELDLYGLIELQDGGYRVTPEGVRQLCRLLHGQGPEE